MTRWEPAHTSTTGTVIGSAVGGSGNTVSNNMITVGAVHAQASLDKLRNVIAVARDGLVMAAEDPKTQTEVSYEIRKLEKELAAERPRGAVVRSRWEQVSAVLSPLAAASGIVAEITDLITKIFGGS